MDFLRDLLYVAYVDLSVYRTHRLGSTLSWFARAVPMGCVTCVTGSCSGACGLSLVRRARALRSSVTPTGVRHAPLSTVPKGLMTR